MGALGGSGGRCPADRSRPLCSSAFSVAAAGASMPTAVTPVSDVAVAGLNDDDLLQEVAHCHPTCRRSTRTICTTSTSTFRTRRAWSPPIRTTTKLAARCMEAYQEKAMLFDLAMDRSLP